MKLHPSSGFATHSPSADHAGARATQIGASATTLDGAILGMSTFARERNRPGLGKTSYGGGEQQLLGLIATHWSSRVSGDGHADLEHVVKVPLPPLGFSTPVVRAQDAKDLVVVVEQRRPHEEPYLAVYARGEGETVARYVEVILYSRAHLQDSGEATSGHDWEIVALAASPTPVPEPMSPMTMARNELELPGGSAAHYSGAQYARALLFWKEHVRALPAGVDVAALRPASHTPQDTGLLLMAREELAAPGTHPGRAFAEAIVTWHRAAVASR